MNFSTKLIHSPFSMDETTGAVTVPIYQTSTFHQTEPLLGQEFDYSRSGNPTRKALEAQIAELENGTRGFAFASGMAATSSVLALFSSGDHIILGEDIYGGTYRVVHNLFQRFGLEFTLIDASDSSQYEKHIKPNTRAFFLETPSNPLLKITNIREVVNIAKSHNILTILDNTFLSPYLQRPLDLGVDIVLHSATKFLNGHSDVVAGLVVTKSEELGQRVYAIQNGFGAVLGPQDSWLLMRGIKTLKVRMDFQQNSAFYLAKELQNSPRIEKVFYPGLQDHLGKEIHDAQSDGPGCVFSILLQPSVSIESFLKKIRFAAIAVSLGGVETIVSYPARMSHASMPKEQRAKLGVSDQLVRISVGLEDKDDLLEDLFNALRTS